MIKGFSKNANRLLSTLSQQVGHLNGSSSLLPEHMLIALISSKDCTGYKILEKLQLNIISLQLSLERFLMEKNEGPVSGDLPYSRRLKTLVDMASVESRTLSSSYIGTEHLLIAAAREENTIFHNFLVTSNVTLTDLRKINAEILEEKQKQFENEQDANENEKKFDNEIKIDLSGIRKSHIKGSYLDEYTVDLTRRAREGLIDPVIGREREIQRMIQVLVRRTKNNPVLIGEPGVGKTAIVESLALRIANNQVPEFLMGKRILSLDLALMVAGTHFRGDFEERLKRVMKEVLEKKNIILFIDELHTLIGAGGPEGGLDGANMMKPALSRGELQCIGSTTRKEYSKYFEKDAALVRRFQQINVDEPSVEETVEILSGIAPFYEKFHGVKYSPDVMELIAKYSQRYITTRSLPDKAIDVLDEAGSIKKISCNEMPLEIQELHKKIYDYTAQKDDLIKMQNFEKAADIRDIIKNLNEELAALNYEYESEISSKNNIVTKKDVCAVISTMTGIPLEDLDENESLRLMNMEDEIHKTVVAQNEAVKKISSAIRRSRAGVSSTKRPTGSFIFLGPTGVGKTLLAKTLAKFLFAREDALIRVDMSDFMEKHNVSRLVGAPPGYVGFEDGGILTEQVRRNPYSVILLDEIEKAHQDVFNLLLQILEEGELHDNHGNVVNFRNTVIIMTSNAGVRQISNENRLGFSSSSEKIMSYSQIKSNAFSELKNIMSPELLNRVDDVIVFESLGKKEIAAILEDQIAELSSRLAEKNIKIRLTSSAKNYLVEHGYEPSMGARPMRRLIQKEIEDEIANLIICSKCESGDEILVSSKTCTQNGENKEKLVVRAIKPKKTEFEIIANTGELFENDDNNNNVPNILKNQMR